VTPETFVNPHLSSAGKVALSPEEVRDGIQAERSNAFVILGLKRSGVLRVIGAPRPYADANSLVRNPTGWLDWHALSSTRLSCSARQRRQ